MLPTPTFAQRARPAGAGPAARPRRAARRPGGVAVRQHATSCSRRTTACCSPARCCCRSTSGSRLPSCAFMLDDSGAVGARSAIPTSPTSTIRCDRSCSATSTRHAGRTARDPWTVPPDVDEDVPAELFYTQGSTGTPKGALLTHRGLYLHAIHYALTLGISGDDVVLHTIPLFHVNGWGTPALRDRPRRRARDAPALRLQPRCCASSRPSGSRGCSWCPRCDRRCSTIRRSTSRDLSSVQQLSVGGAPTPPALLAEAERRSGASASAATA